VNTATADELTTRYGLKSFTAALIVARRPFASLDELRGLSGLTDAQLASIAAVP
jgi:DNA uptake protein ComE-like DNA-binding protein